MSEEILYPKANKSSYFGILEDTFHDVFKKSGDEIKANLSTTEWIIYIGSLIFVLVMPFLYSRLTTENFLTPKEFFSRGFIGILGGLFFSRILYYRFSGKKIGLFKTSLDLPLLAFFGFCVLSILWNFNPPSAIRDLRGVLVIMLLFPVITNVYRSRWQVEILLWIVLFTGLATATIGFLETYNFYFMFDSKGIHYVKEQVLDKQIDYSKFYIPLFPQLASRDYAMGSVVSTFGNRNYLGTYVMFIAFIPLAFIFYYKHYVMKAISFILFSWLLYGLYITRCRAALIGLAIGFIFMIIMVIINDKKFKLTLGYGPIVAIIVIILILAGLAISSLTIKSETMWDKLQSTFSLNRLKSNTYERMWVWYGNNKAFTQNIRTILIGLGFGSFKHFFPLKEGEIFSEKNKSSFTAVTFRQAHNDWLQIFSELGIIGMILFLFLVKRFFSSIQKALRKDIFENDNNEVTENTENYEDFSYIDLSKTTSIKGEHILLIALGASIVAQLFAALPDFPFHRIETAVFAVVFISLVPVFTETNFFKSSPKVAYLEEVKGPICMMLLFTTAFGMISNLVHEHRCWEADTRVRSAEMLMNYPINNPNYPYLALRTRRLLLEAIQLDPLPGDPYNKLSTWYEQAAAGQFNKIYANLLQALNHNSIDLNSLTQIGLLNAPNDLKSKGILIQDLYTLANELEQADKLSLDYANKAWNNINYNARSTYHSIIFRKMHIYYHLLGDIISAYLEARRGLDLTAGEARTTYYFYGSRIALDLIKNYTLIKNPQFSLDELKENSEKWLKELLKYDQHKFQAYASLAYFYSQQNRWSDALNSANEASKIVPNDPNMHNIIGISAYNSGDYNLAIDELQKALQLNPANPIYHRDIGMVYMSQRKFSEAKKHFERIINSSCPQDIKNQVSVELEKLKYLLNNNSEGNNTNGY